MKSVKHYYNKDIAYRMLKKYMIEKYGKEKTNLIWNKAEKELSCLYNQYKDVPLAEQRHTHDNIFPRVALYRVLLEELPEDAMEIIDYAVKNAGDKVGKMLKGLTSLPGMKSLFMKVFSYMAKEMFGDNAGFKQIFYKDTKDELSFDIIECPYCKYCLECECVELVKSFCDSDIYCYGDLSGIDFKRTQALGMGGNCCDFRVVRK